ncbi:MAG: tryptophan synthase subunit alpha [Solirubrobacterales bacterium]|nr:tryptophan synthase subunit alpha [Solirubrobacterales bacterium]
MSNAGHERIAEAFASSGKRAALMPYLMGGFPTAEGAQAVARAYVAGGADLVELGIPFSDPLADGPVIHEAGTRALAAGATTGAVLDLGTEIARHIPVVVMTYANLVLAQGVEAFCAQLAERGLSGLIVPDIPFEEAPALLAACDAAGIALVPLVAPTTPVDRLAAIGGRARGFLYTVSVAGTTGERAEGDYAELVARAKDCTDVPVAVGFGIGTPERAAQVADAGADGVIIGSRLVRAAGDGEDVEALVRGFADALRA